MTKDPLIPKQRREFERIRAELEKKFQPQVDALIESSKIRAEDLAIRIVSRER